MVSAFGVVSNACSTSASSPAMHVPSCRSPVLSIAALSFFVAWSQQMLQDSSE